GRQFAGRSVFSFSEFLTSRHVTQGAGPRRPRFLELGGKPIKSDQILSQMVFGISADLRAPLSAHAYCPLPATLLNDLHHVEFYIALAGIENGVDRCASGM